VRALKAAHADRIALFDGVKDMLRRLRAGGISIAIVSSDAEANVRKTLREAAACVDLFACGASLFGKAAKFRRVLRLTGVAAADAIAVGDEMRDAEAAETAGLAFGAVTWGYARPEALASKAPTFLFSSVWSIADVLVGSHQQTMPEGN
jgi:phosphoglycolate phosphatase